MTVDAIIAGAGIGGLVCALCLHRAGYSVRVYERMAVLEPIGFGFNLQPFSVKLLYELGLENEMDGVGVRTSKTLFYSRRGQLICEDVKGVDAGFNWPMFSVHRGNFQLLLLRRLGEQMGETSVRLGHKLIGFRSHADYVDVDFVNVSTKELHSERAKVLIGADGIKSTVRKLLYPDEGRPLWRGITIYRGVTETEHMYLNGRTMILMGNPNDVELVIYPVGKNLINWACAVRVSQEKTQLSPESPDWTNTGRLEDLLPRIADMKLDFLDIGKLVRSAMVLHEFPMTDREPLSQWTHGRVTLLGDAAHPMYPAGSNGASQTVLDARCLLLAFREHGVTPEGLQAYDDLRRPTANKVVLAARQYGPEEILKIVDERAPTGFEKLTDVIFVDELDSMLSKFRRTTGLDEQKLNHERSLF